jgi:hypothetical protein
MEKVNDKLTGEWLELVKLAQKSGVSKAEFKEFLATKEELRS